MELAEGPLQGDDSGLLQFFKRAYLNPPSSKPYNLKEKELVDLIYTRYKKSHPSWMFINSILQDLFKDQPPGFFVEAGALDGEYLSNTLHLETHKNWTGLLIEADQQSYSILLEKHRKAWSSPSCIATQSYPHSVILSSFGREGKTANWNDRGAARIEKDRVWKGGGPGYKTFQQIQCFPSLTFFLALNVSRVDLFSLDVEGVEMDILRAFPFYKITVDVWVIEHIRPDQNHTIASRASQVKKISWKYEDPELIAFMESRGYYFFDMFCHPIPDYVFVRRDSEIFQRLGVPEHLWMRRGLCFHKANWDIEGAEFVLHLHRDKRHYPQLKYSPH